MTIDSTILFLFVKELTSLLYASQVRQIKQIDNRIMDIEFFCPHQAPVHMIFDTRRPTLYVAPPEAKKNIVYTPPQTFCMTLRKQLEGSRLSSIKQLHFDRIIQFDFDRIETAGAIHTKSLYVELIPSAPNLILVSDGIIIDACLRGEKMNRLLFPGKPYEMQTHTSRMNFLDFSEKEIEGILSFSRSKTVPLDTFLYSTFNGFSRLLVAELARRLAIAPDTDLSTCPKELLPVLAHAIFQLAQEIQSADTLYIYKTDHGKEIASLLHYTEQAQEESLSATEFMTRSATASGTFIAPIQQSLQRKIKNLVQKEERKMAKMKKELEETHNTSLYQLWGNLLSIYAYEKTDGSEKITVSNLFKSPPENEVIPIDPRRSLSANSQDYFKKYRKMKTRLQIGREKIEESRIKIDYLRNMAYFIETMTTQTDLLLLKEELQSSGLDKEISKSSRKKKKEIPSHPLSLTVDGWTIYLGKNNSQNETLTLHQAKKEDVWFHAKALPGSHVVLETHGQPIPEETILKVASLAAYYSKGRDSGKVDVDYTLIKYVKKIPNGPPGLVNYTHQRTLTVIPQKEDALS